MIEIIQEWFDNNTTFNSRIKNNKVLEVELPYEELTCGIVREIADTICECENDTETKLRIKSINSTLELEVDTDEWI